MTAISMQDISSEKRRVSLEKVFFHDLLNAATGMISLLELVEHAYQSNAQAESLLRTTRQCAEYLADEINFSKNLAKAENRELELILEPVRINEIIEKATGFFSMQFENGSARLELRKSEKNGRLVTDRSLLVRILVNLIKNAIEASPRGSTVKIDVVEDELHVRFRVHNEGTMPPHVREQIFRRSFSTKGAGRGFGTYSVQLFTENYLHGRVWFESSEASGTSFFVEIPNVPA